MMAFCCRAWLLLAASALSNACSVEENSGAQPDASVASCPEITLVSVSPLRTRIGEPISIEASAVDRDGTWIAALWSAERGRFVHANALSTSYICEAAGNWNLTLTVQNRQGCQTPLSVPVRCREKTLSP